MLRHKATRRLGLDYRPAYNTSEWLTPGLDTKPTHKDDPGGEGTLTTGRMPRKVDTGSQTTPKGKAG